jgi:hypothetical protein
MEPDSKELDSIESDSQQSDTVEKAQKRNKNIHNILFLKKGLSQGISVYSFS